MRNKNLINETLIFLLESRLEHVANIEALPQREREKHLAYLQLWWSNTFLKILWIKVQI